jgi:hypothetical protein
VAAVGKVTVRMPCVGVVVAHGGYFTPPSGVFRGSILAVLAQGEPEAEAELGGA